MLRKVEAVLSNRTTAQGCINFGMCHVKYTLGIMHWFQDEHHLSHMLSLTGIADAEEYKTFLVTSLD